MAGRRGADDLFVAAAAAAAAAAVTVVGAAATIWATKLISNAAATAIDADGRADADV
jgi:hypothetical protein